MIGKTIGHYRIVEKLGAGGMGEVYLAHDERLDREVALKVLAADALADETSRKRFRKEAHVLSRLNHAHIAIIFDYDTHEGIDFLVMEYIPGVTLGDKLVSGPLKEKEALRLASNIADALDEAHGLGIVHRDLKPGNVIVTQRGHAKVLDFGLAKLAKPVDETTTQHFTQAHLVVGTLPYMSPEHLRGEKVDPRSDIYSFGVVLYEMVTGRRPFTDEQPASLTDSILNRPPPPPGRLAPDLSVRLEEVILKCLEKEPENRYQSVKELTVDLRRLTTPSTAAVSSARPRALSSRKLALAGIGALLVVLAVAAGMGVERLRSWFSGGVGVGINSIVALPSKVHGAEDSNFLTDAIPNALSTRLLEVEGVETKAPPTSLDVERVGGDLAKLADLYGVNAFILSSVTAEADRLLLNIQLVESGTRRLVWGKEYEGSRTGYLELVRVAADGLRAALRPEAAPIQSGVGGPGATEAELAFQRGVYHLAAFGNRKRPEDFDRAFKELTAALALDPSMARAAAAIARLHIARLEAGVPVSEALKEIDHWAYEALRIDNHSGEAYQVLSVAEEMRPEGDRRTRLEHALKAAIYAPRSGYSHHVLGAVLASSSVVLALEAFNEATRQEPLLLNGQLAAAGLLSAQEKTKEGLVRIDRVLSIEPNMPIAVLMRTFLLLSERRVADAEESLRLLDEMVAERRMLPSWVELARDWLAFETAAARGQKPAANEALGRMVRVARGEAPAFPRWEVLTQGTVRLQVQNGSVDSTLETLSARAAAGVVEPYDWLLTSSALEPLRRNDRFQGIVSRSRTQFEDLVATLEEARLRGELPSYLERPLTRARELAPSTANPR